MADNLKVRLGKLLIRWGRWLAPTEPVHVASTTTPNSMFSTMARLELEEMLGYERFVLSECGDAIRTQQGKSSPTRIIINDAEPHSFLLSVEDTIGDTGPEWCAR